MRAIYIDIIKELGPIMFHDTVSRSSSSVEILNDYQTSMDLALSSAFTTAPYPHTTAHCSLRDAVHRSITLNKAGRYHDDVWLAALALVRRKAITEDIDPEIATAISQFTKVVRWHTGARRLFISRQGYVGMCPPYTMKGDMIHVATSDISVPLLLRPSRIGSRQFTGLSDEGAWQCEFVGECYCHGLVIGDHRERVGEKGGTACRDAVII